MFSVVLIAALLPACASPAQDPSAAPVDGRSMTGLSDHGLLKTFRVDGAEVRMSLKRGTEVLEKTIRLRRLV